MEIKRIKVEVEFCEIDVFDAFEYKRRMYLKLPHLNCRVNAYIGNGLTKEVNGTFNAVGLCGPVIEDYEYFCSDTLVKPLKTELKIYE